MTKHNKQSVLGFIATALLVWILISVFNSLFSCNKEADILPKDSTVYSKSLAMPLQNITTWERWLYVDSTQGIYKNTAEKAKLLKYAKKYGFTGFYFYDLSGIVSSPSNDAALAGFLKQCADSGITVRASIGGSKNTFVSGNTKRFQNTQTDPKKKFTRYNLELEWWNNVVTFPSWLTDLTAIAGTTSDNDFYQGWYKNLAGVPDTIAARDQLLNSDRILHHVYVNGYPTYNYANASGRLDVIAKGARQVSTMRGTAFKAKIALIISDEKKSIGAANDFSGGVLIANAAQPNPFKAVEQVLINDFNNKLTAFQRKYIDVIAVIHFDRKWVYRCIPPTP